MNRLRIVRRLADGPATVTELIAHVGLSQPLVSWHLGKLREVGLVTARRNGRETVHTIVPEAFASFAGRQARALGLDDGAGAGQASGERLARLARDPGAYPRPDDADRARLGKVGLTPNGLTIIGFLIACVAAIAAGLQAWIVAGLLVVFGGVFDLFDGALARATGKTCKLGAFMDSTFDRWGEGVVYLGILWGALELGLLAAHRSSPAPRWSRRSWSATRVPSPRAWASYPAPAWPTSGSPRARSGSSS